jgi:hypothetical protein
MRMRPDGDKILINFQAVVRREWHDALDRNEGFNIAKINPDTLRAITDEYHDRKRSEGISEVSPPFPKATIHPLTIHPFLSPSSALSLPNPLATPHATCYTLHVTCYTLHATRHMLHATCYTLLIRYKLCVSMHTPHATMHLLCCPMTQLQRVVSSSGPPHRDHQDSSRGTSGRSSNRHTPYPSPRKKDSRSKSPASPSKQPSPTKPSFRNSAGTFSPSACAVCLGRHRHNVRTCNSTTTFNGGETKTRRSENGRLVCISSGSVLCSDWQRPTGCSATDHPLRHICSGCESLDHGAQVCPRAQAA